MNAMKSILTFIVVAGLLSSLTARAHEKQTPDVNKFEPLPRDLEIQLALSALPPHLRDNATVYVLNPDKGFEVARPGTNGFYAFVARTGDDTFRGTWPLKEYRADILTLFPLMKRALTQGCESSLMPLSFRRNSPRLKS